MLNDDYKDMLRSLPGHDVTYLVVGACAMGLHGCPRAEGGFDIWFEGSLNDSRNIYLAQETFGAALFDLTEETLADTKSGIVIQIGVAPRRIEIITQIDGIHFPEACTRRETISIDDIEIPFRSRENLIKSKLASGRTKNGLEVKYLQNDYPDI